MREVKKIMIFSLITVLAVSMLLIGTSCKVEEAAEEEVAEVAEEVEEVEEVEEAAEEITIAVVPKALDNPVFLDTKIASEAAGEELGITVNFTGSTSSDAAEQATVVEGLIESGIDGLLISVNDADALTGVINDATAAGIKVATFDSDAPDSDRLFYIGSNNYELGKACAEELNDLVGDEEIDLAIMTGVTGASNLEERIDGVEENINDNITVLSVQACDDNVEKSVDVLNTYTPANPDLDAWIVVGGWPFFSTVDSLPELKTFRENGGYFVIIDTFYPMLAFMKEDPPLADVMIGQDFAAMGKMGVELLLDLVNGGALEEEIVITPMEYCTVDNVDDLLATKPPWE
jgi:ribose transport system substrate-binding protein